MGILQAKAGATDHSPRYLSPPPSSPSPPPYPARHSPAPPPSPSPPQPSPPSPSPSPSCSDCGMNWVYCCAVGGKMCWSTRNPPLQLAQVLLGAAPLLACLVVCVVGIVCFRNNETKPALRSVTIARRELIPRMASHWGIFISSPGESRAGLIIEVTGHTDREDGMTEVTFTQGTLEVDVRPRSHWFWYQPGIISSRGAHQDLRRVGAASERAQVVMGETSWTDSEIKCWVQQWRQEHPKYDVFTNNCQGFGKAFCRAAIRNSQWIEFPVSDTRRVQNLLMI